MFVYYEVVSWFGKNTRNNSKNIFKTCVHTVPRTHAFLTGAFAFAYTLFNQTQNTKTLSTSQFMFSFCLAKAYIPNCLIVKTRYHKLLTLTCILIIVAIRNKPLIESET